MRKQRKIRPTEKDVPKGYDSKWEHTLHTTHLKSWKHHTKELINYIVEHTYEPDFVKQINNKTILIEAKGFGITLSIVNTFGLKKYYQLIMN